MSLMEISEEELLELEKEMKGKSLESAVKCLAKAFPDDIFTTAGDIAVVLVSDEKSELLLLVDPGTMTVKGLAWGQRVSTGQ